MRKRLLSLKVHANLDVIISLRNAYYVVLATQQLASLLTENVLGKWCVRAASFQTSQPQHGAFMYRGPKPKRSVLATRGCRSFTLALTYSVPQQHRHFLTPRRLFAGSFLQDSRFWCVLPIGNRLLGIPVLLDSAMRKPPLVWRLVFRSWVLIF